MSSPFLIQPRVHVDVPDELMLWLRNFSEFAEQAHMGLHCTVCRQDIVCEKVFYGTVKLTMKCGCREFVGIDPVALAQKRQAEKLTQELKDGTADLSLH